MEPCEPRGSCTDLREAGGEIPSAYSPVRANVFGEDRPSPYRLPAVKEKHSARGRESPRADRPIGNMARDHKAGGQSEPHAARMGEHCRRCQQGVSGARRLRGDAVAPVVALQAQSQATKGRELSTLAPLRALRARTSEPAWARRAVDEGVRSCPRAGCGKSACPVVCPAKAGMFSRGKACRGKSQKPRSLDSRVAGNQDSEAYRQRLPWGGDESPGRNNSERKSGLESE